MMCAGINSPGTLREVLRGYCGDKNAKPIFAYYDPPWIPVFLRRNEVLIKINVSSLKTDSN